MILGSDLLSVTEPITMKFKHFANHSSFIFLHDYLFLCYAKTPVYFGTGIFRAFHTAIHSRPALSTLVLVLCPSSSTTGMDLLYRGRSWGGCARQCMLYEGWLCKDSLCSVASGGNQERLKEEHKDFDVFSSNEGFAMEQLSFILHAPYTS